MDICGFSVWFWTMTGIAIAVVALFMRHARRSGESSIAEVLSDESGAAYSLSYVMVMPVFLFFVCLIIEVAITMTVKLGTVYAAYAAARSYAVWLPSQPADSSLIESKARQAAAQAMAAFASGEPRGGSGGQVFGAAYDDYAGGEAVHLSSSYVQTKLANANRATAVILEKAPSNWNDDVKVRIRYEMPFRIPAIGRVMGATRSGGHYIYPIESHATVQVEGVKDKSIGGDANPLGIKYDPGEL